MPHSRFFVEESFQMENPILLVGDEAHHLQHVMRKREGEVIELVNGLNALATATIITCKKKEVRVQISEVIEQMPPLPKIICQALLRPSKLDLIIEKGTELGMTELRLFPGELSEKKELTPSQLTRLKTLSISAMKQCGRLDLPHIILMPPLLKWEKVCYSAYFGETANTAPPFLSLYKKNEGALFFIGPESGFTEAEKRELIRLQAQGVSLHPHILRAETAPLVALSLMHASYTQTT